MSSTVFETTMPTMKITPKQRLHVDRRAGGIKHDDHAHQPDRHGGKDHQRRDVRLEQRHQQEIDQQRGQDQAQPRLRNVSCMREYSPLSVDLAPFSSL